jgi:hypothetical protein
MTDRRFIDMASDGVVSRDAIRRQVSGPLVVIDLSYTGIAAIDSGLSRVLQDYPVDFSRFGNPSADRQTPLNFWPVTGVKLAIDAMSATDQAAVNLLSGHFSYRVREVLPPSRLFVTTVRNPIDRILTSYASHAVSMNMTLVEALQSQRPGWAESPFVNDYQVRALSGDAVLDPDVGGARLPSVSNMDRIFGDLGENFVVLGTAERNEDTVIALARQLGIPLTAFVGLAGESGERSLQSSVPADIIAELEQRNRLDFELHVFANSLLDTRIGEDADGFAADRALMRELSARYAGGGDVKELYDFEMEARGRHAPRLCYGSSGIAANAPVLDGPENPNRVAYLDLMEEILINRIYPDISTAPWSANSFNPAERSIGSDWPSTAHTMVGKQRINNVRTLCEKVIVEKVPGDFIETGVWRGGATIMMRAVLKSYGERDRNVFVADSFSGVPSPDAQYSEDEGDVHFEADQLAISQAEVAQNFRRYGLLDRQVRFLPGLFKDTLGDAPIEKLALMRLDGDLYESTKNALEALYAKLSIGGFVIIDDYGAVPGCKAAVDEFRSVHGIVEPLEVIDWAGVYWRKGAEIVVSL